jgi:integrase/recombinase XerC
MLKDSFLKYLLLERNYSEKTILSYGIDLDEFEAYFKSVDEEFEFLING